MLSRLHRGVRSGRRTRNSHSLAPRIEQLEELKLLSGGGLVPVINADTPAQIKAAYGFNDIKFVQNERISIDGFTTPFTFPVVVPGDGRGQTIAILEFGTDPNIQNDVNTFDMQYSLPALTLGSNFTIDDLPGGTTNDPVTSSVAFEESLDVEWAHAIAPAAKILIVSVGSPGDLSTSQSYSDLAIGARYAASQPGVSVVSISYGSLSEFPTESQLDVDYTTPPNHAPVAFVAASGDSPPPTEPLGVMPPTTYPTTEYPAISPEVLAVGGTQFTKLLDGTHQYEDAWDESSGGQSPYEPEPSYQDGVQQTGFRTNPDVAFNATNYSVYDTWDDNGWDTGDGTSFGAPAWSALTAIADQGRADLNRQPLDDLPSAIYQLPTTDFHDITQGTNTADGISASRGYDEVTGLGTPIANRVVEDLLFSATFFNLPPVRKTGPFGPGPNGPEPSFGDNLTAPSTTPSGGQAGFVQGGSASQTHGDASGQPASSNELSASLFTPLLTQTAVGSLAAPLAVVGAPAASAGLPAAMASAEPITLENASVSDSSSLPLFDQFAEPALSDAQAAPVSLGFADPHGVVASPGANVVEVVDQVPAKAAVHKNLGEQTGWLEDAVPSAGTALLTQATDACFERNTWIVDGANPLLQKPAAAVRQQGTSPAFAVTAGILAAWVVRRRLKIGPGVRLHALIDHCVFKGD